MSVVFFCIGAAKAGTTWLHRQLSDHPDCHFRTIKELHYFDALENGKLADELIKHRDQQKALLDRLATRGQAPGAEQSTRLADRAAWMDVLERGGRPDDYLGYLQGGAGDARVIGDMTPSYALLPEARLAQMSGIAPDVRFLYLLRDPLDRLWSHVRMIAARRDDQGQVTERRAGRILRRTLNGAETQIVRRSDYAGALARLASAVPGAQVLIEVFEDMIHGDGLARICDFLRIAPMTPNPRPAHQGQALTMTDEQRQRALAWLEPQYDAAHRALGHMPKSWAMEGVR